MKSIALVPLDYGVSVKMEPDEAERQSPLEEGHSDSSEVESEIVVTVTEAELETENEADSDHLVTLRDAEIEAAIEAWFERGNDFDQRGSDPPN